MNDFIVSIKKVFGIILSFIWGLFNHKEDKENEKKYEKSQEELETNSKTKEAKVQSDIPREEIPSTKSKTKNIEETEEEIYENARKDLEQIFYLKHQLLKLEKKVEQLDTIEDLNDLKQEMQDLLKQMEKIGKIYEKEQTHNTLVKDIQKIYKTSQEIVKENTQNIEEKIEILKEEKTQEVVTEIKQEEIKHEIITEVKEDKVEEVKEIPIELETPNLEFENKQEEQVEKETIPKISLEEIKTVEEKENEPLEDIIFTEIEPFQEEKALPIIVKKSKQEVERKVEHIPKEQLEEKIEKTKKRKNPSAILIAVAAIIAKTLMMAKTLKPGVMLRISPQNTIATALLINNQIRKSRNTIGKKTKKLKYEQVIAKAGLNPTNQLKFVMINSLSEIKSLKEELLRYGMDEEIIHILNQLNEMESELIEKVSELEYTNSNMNTATRYR